MITKIYMRNFFHKVGKNNQGITIIELLLGISISLMIGVFAAAIQKDAFFFNNSLENTLDAQREVRLALQEITTEVRSVSTSNTGAYPLSQIATSSFTFFSDKDDDGLREQIRYFLAGTTLKKGVIKPSGNPIAYDPSQEIVSDFVHNVANAGTAIFDYYDSSYEGTTDPLLLPCDILAIRLVKITLIIEDDPSRPPGPITMTTQVSMRNLKDNL